MQDFVHPQYVIKISKPGMSELSLPRNSLQHRRGYLQKKTHPFLDTIQFGLSSFDAEPMSLRERVLVLFHDCFNRAGFGACTGVKSLDVDTKISIRPNTPGRVQRLF